MASTRYPISREFFPYSKFTPSVSEGFIRMAQKNLKVPGFLRRDAGFRVVSKKISACEGGEIEVLVISPEDIKGPAPCLMDFHGGGFIFPASPSHYHAAMSYARLTGCRVIFPLYRLAPDHPFPYPQEDCFASLLWAYDNAEALDIDPERLGVCGDSAGGALAVTSCLLARKRGIGRMPLFQLLIYPWLDARSDSGSCRRFTDTPMWNSELSKKVTPLTDPHPENIPIEMRSPAETADLTGLPPAYIEVAEFDCLRDDGILYAERLRGAGISVEFRDTRGTMHGFDTKFGAPTSQKMIAERAEYIRHMFQSF